MTLNPIVSVLSAAALVAGAGIVRAQGEPDTTRIYRVPEILVKDLRSPGPDDSVASSVSHIDVGAEAVGNTGLGLADVLEGVPGLQVDNRYNFALGERISMRGFGARAQFGVRGVRVIADGISATFADGQNGLEFIDPSTIESAEVLRGPASSLYGNASGGVILLRTFAPSAGPFAQRFRALAGDNGLLRLESGSSGTIGDISYQLRGSQLDYDGYRPHASARNRNVQAQLGRRFDGGELNVRGGYLDFTAENPGALSRAMLEASRFQAVAGNVRQKTGKSGSQGDLGATLRLAEDSTLVEVTGEMHLREIENPIPGRIIDLSRTAAALRGVVHSAVSLFDAPLMWSAGFDLDAQFDDRRNSLNLDGERGEVTLNQKERVIGAGAFLTGAVSPIAGVRAMGGIRYDGTAFRADDRLVTPADPDDSGDRRMASWSPSFGLLWTPDSSVALFGNVSTAFETPTTSELANRPSGAGGFNPELEPQRALSFEIGGRGELFDELGWSLALYTARIRNELVSFQVPGSPGRDFYRNAASSSHNGVEASLSASPVGGMRFSLSYAYTDARFDEYGAEGADFSGNRLPGVSPQRVSGRLSYLAAFGLFGSLSGRYVSETTVDDANSESSPGYTVLDLRLIWQEGIEIPVGGDWRIRMVPFAGVDNLLDTDYNTAITINAFGGRYYEPGPERSIHGGVELSLAEAAGQ